MRERRKEPREGSEIDPETVCIQTVGAQLNEPSRGSFDERAERSSVSESKEHHDEIDPDGSSREWLRLARQAQMRWHRSECVREEERPAQWTHRGFIELGDRVPFV